MPTLFRPNPSTASQIGEGVFNFFRLNQQRVVQEKVGAEAAEIVMDINTDVQNILAQAAVGQLGTASPDFDPDTVGIRYPQHSSPDSNELVANISKHIQHSVHNHLTQRNLTATQAPFVHRHVIKEFPQWIKRASQIQVDVMQKETRLSKQRAAQKLSQQIQRVGSQTNFTYDPQTGFTMKLPDHDEVRQLYSIWDSIYPSIKDKPGNHTEFAGLITNLLVAEISSPQLEDMDFTQWNAILEGAPIRAVIPAGEVNGQDIGETAIDVSTLQVGKRSVREIVVERVIKSIDRKKKQESVVDAKLKEKAQTILTKGVAKISEMLAGSFGVITPQIKQAAQQLHVKLAPLLGGKNVSSQLSPFLSEKDIRPFDYRTQSATYDASQEIFKEIVNFRDQVVGPEGIFISGVGRDKNALFTQRKESDIRRRLIDATIRGPEGGGITSDASKQLTALLNRIVDKDKTDENKLIQRFEQYIKSLDLQARQKGGFYRGINVEASLLETSQLLLDFHNRLESYRRQNLPLTLGRVSSAAFDVIGKNAALLADIAKESIILARGMSGEKAEISDTEVGITRWRVFRPFLRLLESPDTYRVYEQYRSLYSLITNFYEEILNDPTGEGEKFLTPGDVEIMARHAKKIVMAKEYQKYLRDGNYRATLHNKILEAHAAKNSQEWQDYLKTRTFAPNTIGAMRLSWEQFHILNPTSYPDSIWTSYQARSVWDVQPPTMNLAEPKGKP